MRSFDLLIGDSLVKTVPKITIKYPYDGKPVGEVTFGGADEIELAIRSACDSLPAISRMPAYARANVLRGIAIGIKGKLTELTEVIRDEAGKPVRLARAEVERAADVFSIAAEEATRIEGELLPLDVAPHGVGKTGLVRRVPIGPILAITPFNFPLNLTAHKVAPAIAAGNSIVVKPASQTPMSSS
ncbi:MAG: aldehyde dehydrogenase family protein, partial [Chloroflexota bacterium]|nr:aldehyde dehydrogenase family protein [Chloroflexota bacterium]